MHTYFVLSTCKSGPKECSDRFTYAKIEIAEQVWMKDISSKTRKKNSYFLKIIFEIKTCKCESLHSCRWTCQKSIQIRARGFGIGYEMSFDTWQPKCSIEIDDNALPQRMHGGVQSIAYRIRQTYVFLRMIRMIKCVIQPCMVCRKTYLKSYSTPNPALPKFRVNTKNRGYGWVGTDYTVPLYCMSEGITRLWRYMFYF